MVKYTLIYFNARARAELARLLFAEAGVEYEDKRVTFEEWGKLKPTTPAGQLPLLEVDGEKFCQSMAIARYIARTTSQYGANDLEVLRIDMLLDTAVDLVDLAVRIKFCKDEKQKEELQKQLSDKAPPVFKLFSDTLSRTGTGYLVGSKVSIADLAVFHFFPMVTSICGVPSVADEMKKHANLVQHQEKIGNLPKIKAWVEKRPQTDM